MSDLTPEARAMFEHACATGAMPESPGRFQLWSCKDMNDYATAKDAWQATLKPSDPRHREMFEIIGAGNSAYVRLWWGGYAYEWTLNRFKTPNNLVEMVVHVSEKGWEHTTAKRVAKLIRAIYHAKGWDLYGRSR